MNDTNYKLRAWMGANKISGREMAKRLEMPYPTFRMKMLGNSEWKLPEIHSIMTVTGLAFDELF